MASARPRAAWMTGILASAAAATLLTGTPAHAVAGDPVPDGEYAFTAKLDIDGRRACSATLVQQEWLPITAASCFAKVTPGAPKWKTTATIGRTDLGREDGGAVVDVVELVPREDRDLVMARLASPVAGVKPIDGISTAPVRKGDGLWAAGYGRTKDEWVPDRLHAARFTVDSVDATSLRLTGESPDAAVCQGDTGGPLFDRISTFRTLTGVHSTSGQAGCFGTDESEKRRTASETRVDDIAGWIKAVAARTTLPRVNWKDAVQVVPGRFTAHNDNERSDLFVVWADGSASLFEGSGQADPKLPFWKEHKLAAKGSYWKNARSLAAGSHTDPNRRDNLVALWADGSTSMYPGTSDNGISKEIQLVG